jgi:hypothetical protein
VAGCDCTQKPIITAREVGSLAQHLTGYTFNDLRIWASVVRERDQTGEAVFVEYRDAARDLRCGGGGGTFANDVEAFAGWGQGVEAARETGNGQGTTVGVISANQSLHEAANSSKVSSATAMSMSRSLPASAAPRASAPCSHSPRTRGSA